MRHGRLCESGSSKAFLLYRGEMSFRGSESSWSGNCKAFAANTVALSLKNSYPKPKVENFGTYLATFTLNVKFVKLSFKTYPKFQIYETVVQKLTLNIIFAKLSFKSSP